MVVSTVHWNVALVGQRTMAIMLAAGGETVERFWLWKASNCSRSFGVAPMGSVALETAVSTGRMPRQPTAARSRSGVICICKIIGGDVEVRAMTSLRAAVPLVNV